MEKSATKDLTVGSPMKLILEFSIPLLFGFLFQQFYSLIDTIIVGRTLGVNALAAVGSTGSVFFMIIGFCMGVCSGFAIPVAQRFGAKDESGMRRMVANSMWLCIVFAAIMTVVISAFCRNILQWMNTPEDIIESAYAYIIVIFMGIPITYLYNMLSGIIRSLGDSKTPVYFLVLSSVLNIILDFVCIINLHMGVAGAAVATVISQGVAGVGCLFYMIYKFPILHLQKEEWKMDTHSMKILCGMGIPMGLQYSITAIGSVILQASVNGLGSIAVASMTAGSKISFFFCCPFDALGATMATYGGQNIGARRLDRIREGFIKCSYLGIGYSVLAFIFMLFFAGKITLLFVDAKETVIIQQASEYLIITMAFFILLAFVNIIRFLIQGMGFSKFAILAGVFEMAARMLTGFLLVPIGGFTAACFASPIAWIFANAFLFPAYFYVMKKCKREFGELQELEEG
ncbi:MAG: MATE family efflux transporter [Lachnospiraceae bacterium]|nr:MATE family efflux transporter [Lachnospiraceae bacterium]